MWPWQQKKTIYLTNKRFGQRFVCMNGWTNDQAKKKIEYMWETWK